MTFRRGVAITLMLVALAAYGLHGDTQATVPAVVSPRVDANESAPPSLITEPDAGIAPIITMIENASSSVDVVMYQLEDTDIERALVADEKRGVDVRVLLNGGYYGMKENTDNDAAYQYLSQNGVAIHWTPSYFALTHEKSIVVDGATALIMTMNLTPQYYASSREFVIVDHDAADVAAIESAFGDDWNDDETTADSADDLVWSPGSEPALLSLINGAHSSLDIYNEEMADPAITSALEDAARRGVAVRIDMTYSSSWKKAFESLTQAGVQVRTYAATAPLYIHAKVIVADDAQAFVGSENFSSGSLSKNRELGIIVADSDMISSIENTFQKDWAGATPFTP